MNKFFEERTFINDELKEVAANFNTANIDALWVKAGAEVNQFKTISQRKQTYLCRWWNYGLLPLE